MIYATNQPSYAQSFPPSPPLLSSPRLFSTFLPDIQQFQLVEVRPRRPSRLSGEVGPLSPLAKDLSTETTKEPTRITLIVQKQCLRILVAR